MKLFYLILIFIFPIISHAQVSDVKVQLKESYKNYENALKEIKFAITKLEDCDKTKSIDVIHRNASDANKYLSLAKRIISYAKDRAYHAEKEASKTNCSKVQDQVKDVKNYFYDAERDIASANGTLSIVKYNKRDLGLLNQSISDAETDINRALKKMNEAVFKLGNALAILQECNQK